jgi:hypothetical protein
MTIPSAGLSDAERLVVSPRRAKHMLDCGNRAPDRPPGRQGTSGGDFHRRGTGASIFGARVLDVTLGELFDDGPPSGIHSPTASRPRLAELEHELAGGPVGELCGCG